MDSKNKKVEGCHHLCSGMKPHHSGRPQKS